MTGTFIVILSSGILVIHWLSFSLTGVRPLSALTSGVVFENRVFGTRVRVYWSSSSPLANQLDCKDSWCNFFIFVQGDLWFWLGIRGSGFMGVVLTSRVRDSESKPSYYLPMFEFGFQSSLFLYVPSGFGIRALILCTHVWVQFQVSMLPLFVRAFGVRD